MSNGWLVIRLDDDAAVYHAAVQVLWEASLQQHAAVAAFNGTCVSSCRELIENPFRPKSYITSITFKLRMSSNFLAISGSTPVP